MTKRTLNQNAKYVQELIDLIEPDFKFFNKPRNRLKAVNSNLNSNLFKIDRLSQLKKDIDSIEDCNLKNKSKNLILGDGDINSPVMFIGEAPGEIEEKSGLTFQGNHGALLNKMLNAINLNRDKVYIAYTINFRPPNDRKPTSNEIKRY